MVRYKDSAETRRDHKCLQKKVFCQERFYRLQKHLASRKQNIKKRGMTQGF